jgi:hypothetical protein
VGSSTANNTDIYPCFPISSANVRGPTISRHANKYLRNICVQWVSGDLTPGVKLTTHLHQVPRLRVKGKVVPVLLTEHHAMKAHWGVEAQLHAILASELDGGDWSASRPDRFTPRKRAPGTHWIGGWVCPRVGLDAVFPAPAGSRTPDHPARSPALYH